MQYDPCQYMNVSILLCQRDEQIRKKDRLAEKCKALEHSVGRQRLLKENLSELVKSLRSAETGNGFNEELVQAAVERIIVDADGNIEVRFVFHDVIEQLTALWKGDDLS